MAGIVCAIRGGPDSRPTIQHAIRLARETNLQIEFLYVVNLDFLARTTRSPGSSLFRADEFDEFSAQLEAAGDLKIVPVTQD